MNRTRTQTIITILLSIAVTIITALGYDALILQPRLASLTTARPLPARAPGDSNFTNVISDGYLVIAAPTAQATGTPAAIINSAASGNLLEVQKATTPVFKIGNAGAITGNVLQYASSGQKIICGSTTITGTGTLPTGLATPSYVQLSLAQDVTGDCNRLSYTNTAATVTAKCYNSAATPAASSAAAAVNWCAIGTP